MENKELSLSDLVSNFILFLIRNKILIISITLFGIFSVIMFQKFKPAYYKTIAIATSGISVYERLEDDEPLNQYAAVNLINNLDQYLRKGDYFSVSKKLQINLSQANKIRKISAEHIVREDKDKKKHNTSMFYITLYVNDFTIIEDVQNGLLYYFNDNPYIENYKNIFNRTNNELISFIDQEIAEKKELRSKYTSYSDIRAINNDNKEDIPFSNEFAELKMLQHNLVTQNSRGSLEYIDEFTSTEVAEREIAIWSVLFGVISFLLSLLVALVLEVNKNKSIQK